MDECVRIRQPTKAKRAFTFVGEKRERQWGGWYRDVQLSDGTVVLVGVEKGRPAKGMYGVKGFMWHGVVRGKDGRTIWGGQVDKSCGAERLLWVARLIPDNTPCRQEPHVFSYRLGHVRTCQTGICATSKKWSPF